MARPKGWKMKVDNKMRGAFGETDYEEKTVRINKKRHKNKQALKEFAKKDQSLLNTIAHELKHVKHPKMTEKNVRKETRKDVHTMSPKLKRNLYKLFQ